MTTQIHLLKHQPDGRKHLGALCSETADRGTETLYPLHGTSQAIIKCLLKKSLLKMAGDHRGERVTCLNGILWITQSGNPEDFMVRSGEAFSITQKGTIVIEGLVETRLKITNQDVKRQGLPRTHISLPGFKE